MKILPRPKLLEIRGRPVPGPPAVLLILQSSSRLQPAVNFFNRIGAVRAEARGVGATPVAMGARDGSAAETPKGVSFANRVSASRKCVETRVERARAFHLAC